METPASSAPSSSASSAATPAASAPTRLPAVSAIGVTAKSPANGYGHISFCDPTLAAWTSFALRVQPWGGVGVDERLLTVCKGRSGGERVLLTDAAVVEFIRGHDTRRHPPVVQLRTLEEIELRAAHASPKIRKSMLAAVEAERERRFDREFERLQLEASQPP